MFASSFVRAANATSKRTITQAVRPNAGRQSHQRWSSSQSTYQRMHSTAKPIQSSTTLWAAAAAIVGAGGFYLLSGPSKSQDDLNPSGSHTVPTPAGPQKQLPPAANAKPVNYEEIYKEITNILEADSKWDDGSLGPILVRLAWHASGTYDKAAGNGGSNKATMRFKDESQHGGNAGLGHARDFLEKIHQKYPGISYGDLWTLAGVVAIQQMGGPVIPWRPGRTDGTEGDQTPDGRLPDGAKGIPHLRDIFYRQGFNDQEIVALSGAHSLGRCHKDRSGFDGPWTPSPTVVTNDYYKQLLEKTWVERKWNGPRQFQDKETRELMMLPTDMALLEEPGMKKWVQAYAQDEELWRKDFAAVLVKLFENGVPFKKDTKVYHFKTIE